MDRRAVQYFPNSPGRLSASAFLGVTSVGPGNVFQPGGLRPRFIQPTDPFIPEPTRDLRCACIYHRTAALLLWYLSACLFGRNPLISNPALPFIGWLLLLHTLLPKAPYGSLTAR